MRPWGLDSWYQCLNHTLCVHLWALIRHHEFVLAQKMSLHSRLGIMCCICQRAYLITLNGKPINNNFFGSGMFMKRLEQVCSPFFQGYLWLCLWCFCWVLPTSLTGSAWLVVRNTFSKVMLSWLQPRPSGSHWSHTGLHLTCPKNHSTEL